MLMRSPDKNQSLQLLIERGIPISTIIDVGVCHGTPELVSYFPDLKHILFEPVLEFNEHIKYFYSQLDYDLFPFAVSDVDGEAILKTRAVIPDMEISHSGLVESEILENKDFRKIQKVTLDSFIPSLSLEEPFLLKIDIDGQEMKVINGALNILKKCSIVIVECQRSELSQRISAVQASGFTLFDLCEPCYYDKVFWQCDAIFIRTDLFLKFFSQLTGKIEPGMYEIFRAPPVAVG
jgi:FkbM family methyltransferase